MQQKMQQKCQVLAQGVSLVALFCLALPVVAGGQAGDKAYLQGAYRKMDGAISRGDADGLVAFLHPDYVNTDKEGLASSGGKKGWRKDMSKAFTDAAAAGAKMTQQTAITHISFSKQGATVDKSSTLTAVVLVKNQRVESKGNSLIRDFWVKRGSTWLLKTSKTLTEYPQTATINGRPMPPP